MPGDTDVLVEFNRALARETEDRALPVGRLRRGVAAVFADSARGFYLVAEKGGEVVGALMVTFEWSDWHNGQYWWIQSVYVRPAFRRGGVYRALHRAVKARARRCPEVCGFRLYVERDNRVAQAVYRRLGMAETRYLVYEEMRPAQRGKGRVPGH